MKTEKLEPAFPECKQISDGSIVFNTGMSKRFYAACAAMQGILASWNHDSMPEGNGIILTVNTAYELADELLKQENE